MTTNTIHILHIDDEPDFSDVVATFLEREDDRIEVQTATNPDGGLEILTDHDVDCIVSDYDMPRQNGIEFLKTVREEYPDLPFILYTGKGSEEISSKAITAGVTDYLQKRGGTEQYKLLANRVCNAVEQYRSTQEAKQTRRQLQNLAESTPHCVWMFDRDWEELLFVSGYEEIWNRPTAAIRDNPQDFLNDVHPEDRDFVQNAMKRMSNGESIDIEYRILRSDGESRWVWVQGEPVFDDDGAVRSVVGFTRDVTDRKEREQRYDAIFNQTYQFTGLLEPDGTLIEANQTALEFGGLDREDVIGKKMWKAEWSQHSDETEARARQAVERAANGEFVRHELPVQGAEREAIIDFSVRPITDDEGNVTLLIPEGRDITDRREAEQTLHEEQQFVQSILQSLPDPLYAYDTEGYPIRWNDEFRTVTGYSDEEIEEMHVTDFVPEDETGTIAANFQTILDEGRSVTVESAFETKEGIRIPYEFTVGPLEDADGTFRGVTGIGRDISDRTVYEERLKSLSQTTHKLVGAETRDEVATIGVETAHDLLGLDANAIHLYDEDTEGLVPVAGTDSLYDLIGEPPTFTGDDSIAWRVYEQGEILALDDVHEDPDIYNPETLVQSELYLPLGEHGILIAASPSSKTFDEQDVLLGEILAGGLATALEQVERTEQLRARERELTEQNGRLEEFVSIVSHDLRNPLNIAEGRLELAQEECDSEHLEQVKQAHNWMRILITDLLALASAGDAVIDRNPVDLAALADGCWTNVETAQATLVTDIDRRIYADESRLKQVFENLIRNAIEHGDQDVTVTVGELADGFYIEDNGPGIPEADRDSVFEAGYSTSENGTGFGLNIVKKIVEIHDWEICVTDGTEGGARFEITGVKVATE